MFVATANAKIVTHKYDAIMIQSSYVVKKLLLSNKSVIVDIRLCPALRYSMMSPLENNHSTNPSCHPVSHIEYMTYAIFSSSVPG